MFFHGGGGDGDGDTVDLYNGNHFNKIKHAGF
jgi:hypothetical protein